MSRAAALLLCLLGCNVWKAVTKTLRAPDAAQGRCGWAAPGSPSLPPPGFCRASGFAAPRGRGQGRPRWGLPPGGCGVPALRPRLLLAAGASPLARAAGPLETGGHQTPGERPAPRRQPPLPLSLRGSAGGGGGIPASELLGSLPPRSPFPLVAPRACARAARCTCAGQVRRARGSRWAEGSRLPAR